MKRLFSLFFMLVLSVSVFSFSSGASFSNELKYVKYDLDVKAQWDAYFTSQDVNLGVTTVSFSQVAWDSMNDAAQSTLVGEMDSYRRLLTACETLNAYFNPSLKYGFLEYLLFHYDEHVVKSFVGWVGERLHFRVGVHDLYGYVIYETNTGLMFCNQSGAFPYYDPTITDPDTGEEVEDTSLGGKWVRVDKVSSYKNVINEATLNDLVVALATSGESVKMEVFQDRYKGIQSKTRFENGIPFVYCDSQSRQYVMLLDEDQWIVDDPNDYYTGTEGDNIYNGGDTENNTLLDLDSNVAWFPDGTFQYIHNLIYDESQKTYYVDAHQEYDIDNNTYITNNYHYEYHIDYTSITYIGQTEEYNKTYELYYELPDGRSSADLTAEELLALNVAVDVVPYIRSADDTSIRALYHFDGDVRDSSYWNYLGEFQWTKGASITYMDAGVFDGALYLDETEHDFTIKLPSNISTSDFTLQFRYYQSYTAAPQSDSYIQIDSWKPLVFTGSQFVSSAGSIVFGATSIGNWQEICIQRKDGETTWFLNGVPVRTGTAQNGVSFGNEIQFVFGSSQQTYKYLDEFRFTHKALYDTSGYTPSAVPFDTNLSLVLPDGKVPIADEHWYFDTTITPVQSFDFTAGVNPDSSLITSARLGGTYYYQEYPIWSYNSYQYTQLSFNLGYATLSRTYSGIYGGSGNGTFDGGLMTMIGHYHNGKQHYSNLTPGDYVFSVVDVDCNIYSFPFTVSSTNVISAPNTSVDFEWGSLQWHTASAVSGYPNADLLCILPNAGVDFDIVYMELVAGSQPNTGHEYVTGVVGMDADDLNTPTLAVRTDLDITGYQLGGVRPSLPEKGLVWGLVEDGRITSLQIYNGQAWEQVDGRIWTGSRWVPYYAYDILLLKDMYDIIESDPSLDYIYTEAGFWKWLQNAWGEMMKKLDQIITLLGGTPGTGTTCEHVYESEITRQPGCVEPGNRTYTCSECGHSYVELIDATGHDWIVTNSVPDVLDEEGNVIEEGYDELTCSVCDTVNRDYGDGPEEVDLFDALGDFIAEGITWILDKLTELADSLRSITDTFNSFVEKAAALAGGFPLFFGAFMALIPEEIATIMWLFVVGMVVLAVWKKWSN